MDTGVGQAPRLEMGADSSEVHAPTRTKCLDTHCKMHHPSQVYTSHQAATLPPRIPHASHLLGLGCLRVGIVTALLRLLLGVACGRATCRPGLGTRRPCLSTIAALLSIGPASRSGLVIRHRWSEEWSSGGRHVTNLLRMVSVSCNTGPPLSSDWTQERRRRRRNPTHPPSPAAAAFQRTHTAVVVPGPGTTRPSRKACQQGQAGRADRVAAV